MVREANKIVSEEWTLRMNEKFKKYKKRFESVQTMAESKHAMQYLFKVASEKQALASSYEWDLQELNSHYEEVEKELKELKKAHQEEINKISREHEDKILFLLRQMSQTEVGI